MVASIPNNAQGTGFQISADLMFQPTKGIERSPPVNEHLLQTLRQTRFDAPETCERFMQTFSDATDVLFTIAKIGVGHELLPHLQARGISGGERNRSRNTAIMWAIASARNETAKALMQNEQTILTRKIKGMRVIPPCISLSARVIPFAKNKFIN